MANDAARALRLEVSTAVLELIAVVARHRGCSVRDILGSPVGQQVEEGVMRLMRDALEWEAPGDDVTPVVDVWVDPGDPLVEIVNVERRSQRPTQPAPATPTRRDFLPPVQPPKRKR